jgi:acetyltransferase-like isoleucine patch superfamily enzyme
MAASPMEDFIAQIRAAYRFLQARKRREFDRHVPFGDLISERSEIAAAYGFGEGTTCYDNVVILGDVTVGRHSWIGPNVVLDGRGGLQIGDYVSVSAGVQIYTHDTVAWSLSRGVAPMPLSPTKIGSGVYIGPNSVIKRGVTIGDGSVIGAMSYVDSDIPGGMRAWGVPARVIGSAPPVP